MNLFGQKIDLKGAASDLGGSLKSGGDTGAMVEDLAGSTLQSIPFVGGFLSGLSEKLEIGKNIGLVQKYGWSSWGASGSPEQTKAQFAERVYPWFTAQMAKVVPENMGEQLTYVYSFLKVQMQYKKKLEKHHSRAKSTKLGNQEAVKTLGEMIAGIEKTISEMKSKGIKVTSSTYSAKGGSFGFVDVFDGDGTIRDGDTLGSSGSVGGNITFKKFVVDAESIRSIQVDEKGQIEVKQGGSGSGVALAGLGLLGLFKAFG